MREETLLPDVTLMQSADVLFIRSPHPLEALSSAVVGGGFSHVRYILNRHVHKNYDHPRPAEDMEAFARSIGIAEPFIGLMTAVYLKNTLIVREWAHDIQVVLVGTVGLSNRIAAGVTPPAPIRAGTINMILLVDAQLSAAAMVNAIITATEAKTAVLHERGLLSPAGAPVTGTSTDAIVIASTGKGHVHAYAGPVSPVGWLIARAVRTLLHQHFASTENDTMSAGE